MRTEIVTATLAGLLHDIGKFAQRSGAFEGAHAEVGARLAESWRDWLPAYAWEDVLDAVAAHHRKGHFPRKRIEKIVQIADGLAAGERRSEVVVRSDPASAPLVPVVSRVSLATPVVGEPRWYDLSELSIQEAVLFPQRSPLNVNPEGYERHWRGFTKELTLLAQSGCVDNEQRLATLLALLRKYLWCVPSATPWQADDDERTLPDVSLYDHLKVTAALAACLEAGLTDDGLDDLYRQRAAWGRPIALMVRGDISGIQSFIYRITRPEAEAEFEDVAKRLRGRSFYLTLLGDIAADLIIRHLGLSAVNVLFLGGGRFDLLVPVGARTERALQEARATLENWLLRQFTGDLGLQMAVGEVRPDDLGDMRRVYAQLETGLQVSKQRKWERYLQHEEFHVAPADEYHACRVCHTTPLQNPGTCGLCAEQAELGKRLPHATHLAFVYGDVPGASGFWLRDFAEAFGVQIGVLGDTEVATLLERLARQRDGEPSVMVYRLNETAFLRDDAPRGVGMGFRFLANAAPVARQPLQVSGSQPVAPNDVLHFEAIAHLSTGAERIGVLKADVDHLGLLLGEGLDDGKPEGMRPTISRLAALSSAVETFFGGWLNELCNQVSQEWAAAQHRLSTDEMHPWTDAVDGLFYVMYSGGDDLLIVGPWDGVLALAHHLREGWCGYACGNPNVTLSAGIVVVKPHYPVQRFAQEVNAALEEAKSAGRNRVTVFGRTVPWTDADCSFERLLALGRDLVDELRAGEVPRTLIHDLGRLERQHRNAISGQPLKPMFTPRLYYTLARRLSKEVRERLMQRLLGAMPEMQIPVSYVSLMTRKE